MNAARIIRAAIPEATDETISHIVWGRTCYPFGEVTPRTLYKTASQWKRACKSKIRLCDWCNKRAVPGEWMCESCNKALAPTEDKEI